MKVIITKHLSRKTRTGKSVLTERIDCKKEEVEAKANAYIFDRVNRQNFIPVVKFEVKVYDYKNRKVNQWEYQPTYRA